jgi:GNAT superfamily N-acetyltransferase
MRVRMIQSGDGEQLWQLVMAYLKETWGQGGDFPPTLSNATAFTVYAIEGAAAGDPCLVAEDDGKLIGFCFARGIEMPTMETRHRSIRSWGTYIAPEYRSKGVGVSLFIVAGRMARIAGYTRFIGMTVGTDYEKHALGVVDRIPGMQEVGKVLVMDLTRKTKEEADEVKPNGAAKDEVLA